MARQNRADLILKARERLMNRHAGPAGVGEDDIHAVVDQALHQDIRAGKRCVLVGHRTKLSKVGKAN